MDQRTLLGRLLSPAGFGLVLLLFLLPFVAVSCGSNQQQVTATFTGIDMVVAGQPDITGSGISDEEADDINGLFLDQYDSEPFAILALLVLLGAMGSALVQPARQRLTAQTALAALAVLLVVTAEARAVHRLEDVHLPTNPDNPGGELPQGVAHPLYGFYLVLILLILLAAAHGLALYRARYGAAVVASAAGPSRSPRTTGPPGRPVELPPTGAGFLAGAFSDEDDQATADYADADQDTVPDPDNPWRRP
jgi:hypothetical protein